MEVKKLIKYFLLCGAAYFTAACGIILIVLSILTGQNANLGIVPSKFLLVMAFCYVLSLGNTLRRAFKSSNAAGWAIHAICLIGGFLAFLLIFEIKLVPALIATAFFVAVYIPMAMLKAYKERKGCGYTSLSSKHRQHKTLNRRSDKVNDEKNTAETDNSYQNLFS